MASLSNSEILHTVNDIIKHVSQRDIEKLKKDDPPAFVQNVEEKFADFKALMPGLFMMACEQGTAFEMPRLIEMLAKRNNIQNNVSTIQEESVKMGKRYADEFIEPILPNAKRKDE